MKTNDELCHDVMEELKWDPQLIDAHSQIGVATNDGVVTLSGSLSSYIKKLAAEEAAQRVSGVKVVATDLKVKFESHGRWTDTEIAEAIKNSLLWNSQINEDHIEVKVDNGWVYLSGQVEYGYQQLSVQNSIETLFGIRGITNDIIVIPKLLDTQEMKSKIEAAYLRNAKLDSSTITIETSGSKVILTGKVGSCAEKREAQTIAWLSPGVDAVENNIEVETELYSN